MQPIVSAEGLTKCYDGQTVVDGITLQVQPGECFGLLGPNGAGKTTTLRMLLGMTPPDEGRLEVLGYTIPDEGPVMRKLMGVVAQQDNLDPDFTVVENLRTSRWANGTRAFRPCWPSPRWSTRPGRGSMNSPVG